MKTVQLSRKRDFDYTKFVKRSAMDSDYSLYIKNDTIILDKDTNQLIGVYVKLKQKPLRLLEVIRGIRYVKDVRTEGLKTQSRIFGYRPRETIRKDFCSSTSLATEAPISHKIICDFAQELSKIYKTYCGDVYKEHEKISNDKILKDWKIKGTPFTSGIVNKNNPLKYHFDSGNFQNVYSNMVAFKNRVTGGHLAIPEYDLGLEIADCSVLLFDGQKLLHGVTPIQYHSPTSYRFTIVYYTLKKMWNCEPLSEELARVKRIKTAREIKRYERLTGARPRDKL